MDERPEAYEEVLEEFQSHYHEYLEIREHEGPEVADLYAEGARLELKMLEEHQQELRQELEELEQLGEDEIVERVAELLDDEEDEDGDGGDDDHDDEEEGDDDDE